MEEKAQQTAKQRYYQEQQRRKKLQIRFFSMAFVCILLLSGVITFFIELPGKLQAREKNPPSAASGATSTAQGDGAQPPPTQPVAGVIGPQKAEEMGYTAPSATVTALVESGRVDMEYFSDAIFIGDSLTRGFEVYASGISNAHYAAYVGVGPKQLISGTVTNIKGDVVTAIDEILAASPKKVYLLLGTNALPLLEDEAFLKYYNEFLDFLTPQLPADTLYYLQGIPPVTQTKANGDEDYSNTRITALNDAIARMAFSRGFHYLNLPSALADDEGGLRAEFVAGTDGIHLNGAGYEVWKDFLVTHTTYNKSNPYIAGSPYLLA